MARLTIFEKPDDYAAFMRVVAGTSKIVPLPMYAIVAMPNQWQFVVRPQTGDQVNEFFRRLTVMYSMLWHAQYAAGGTGYLDQGRFKSFPIRRKSADGDEIRRTESRASQLHRACRRLALEFR